MPYLNFLEFIVKPNIITILIKLYDLYACLINNLHDINWSSINFFDLSLELIKLTN